MCACVCACVPLLPQITIMPNRAIYRGVYSMRVCIYMHVCFVYCLLMSLGRVKHNTSSLTCVQQTHRRAHTSETLIWCGRAVILAVLTLWAPLSLPLCLCRSLSLYIFPPPYPFGLRSQSSVHQLLPRAVSVCFHVNVCVCHFTMHLLAGLGHGVKMRIRRLY